MSELFYGLLRRKVLWVYQERSLLLLVSLGDLATVILAYGWLLLIIINLTHEMNYKKNKFLEITNF
jgi:hypothetical protein